MKTGRMSTGRMNRPAKDQLPTEGAWMIGVCAEVGAPQG